MLLQILGLEDLAQALVSRIISDKVLGEDWGNLEDLGRVSKVLGKGLDKVLADSLLFPVLLEMVLEGILLILVLAPRGVLMVCDSNRAE